MKETISLGIEITSASVVEATKNMKEFAAACELATAAFNEFLKVSELAKAKVN